MKLSTAAIHGLTPARILVLARRAPVSYFCSITDRAGGGWDNHVACGIYFVESDGTLLIIASYVVLVVVEVVFASQKNHISLYLLEEEVVNVHRGMLAGLNVSKGCIKYSRPDKVDFGVVKTLLESTRASHGDIC